MRLEDPGSRMRIHILRSEIEIGQLAKSLKEFMGLSRTCKSLLPIGIADSGAEWFAMENKVVIQTPNEI